MTQHQSLRCTPCAENWPHEAGFERCPQCGEVTWGSTGEVSVTESEIRHIQFEQYLARRESEDRALLERTEPFAFAQYLMDAAEEQIEREGGVLD